jgi:segregation and condensation protein A
MPHQEKESFGAATHGAPLSSEDFSEGGVRLTFGDGETLVVDVEGFEGPLDLLLALARTQKVDILKISVLALAEQYLAFIEEARRLRLELAADYLVMAAWLAYLKSRLLLPQSENDEAPSGEEMAARLAFQLKRLAAMREAAGQLMTRKRLGVDIFPRGAPEGIRLITTSRYQASLYDLLTSYAQQRVRRDANRYQLQSLVVVTIEEARKRLEGMFGKMADWGRLEGFMPAPPRDNPRLRRSALASTLAATLELVREGALEVRQLVPFGPVYVRRKNLSPSLRTDQ